MIEAKTFEIRDKGTFIPAVGVRIDLASVPFDSQDHYLMRRAGYGPEPLVLLTALDGRRSEYDPYNWADRTWQTAHLFIQESWEELQSGAVVDVQFILREAKEPKASERLTAHR